jgi:hypothetical protein
MHINTAHELFAKYCHLAIMPLTSQTIKENLDKTFHQMRVNIWRKSNHTTKTKLGFQIFTGLFTSVKSTGKKIKKLKKLKKIYRQR